MITQMKKELIIDNEHASLWYYPENKIVHHIVHKYLYGELFQNLLLTGAEIFEKEHCTKWLSDDRNSSAIRKSDLQWGNDVWKPRILKVGWKYWAVILPDLTVGKLSMKSLIGQYQKEGLFIETFDSADLALTWLSDK
jgi:hypothetical protein